MSHARKVFAVAVLAALVWALAPVAEAQKPIRIGASLSQTGTYAALGQNQLHGYQLCIKDTNDKDGVLGRKLDLVVHDDGSDPAKAIRFYEKLLTQDKMDLVLAPYSSPITDAVADLTEKRKQPMVAPSAPATSIRAANPDVLGVATNIFEDGVTIIRQMKDLGVSPRMVGGSGGLSEPRLHEVLGRDAEFVYGTVPWLPELVEVRAGGLIPVARQYPGAREFVEASRKEFPGAGVSANAYGACQVLVEAVRRAGSLHGAKVRDAISKMDHDTVFGRFRVDPDGIQIGHRNVIFQWQDGKRAIVWPEELAPAAPRFPTPPWGQRP